MKIIIFSDSFKHFETPIKEYEKRLGKDVEVIVLKPSKRKDIPGIVEEETDILSQKLSSMKGFKVLLYIDGKILSTEKLYELMESKKQNYPDIIFVIGGAYGVNYEKIRSQIDFLLSFSPMTFPHSMAYMILLEQLYRVSMIKKGSGYHH